MACKFITELYKLRKLSVESVENTESFAEYKKYLHVVRPIESELRTLLHHVNETNRKALVLLCGSAGDGKSHLISYLRHADQAHLLDQFELYNDATESAAPSLTSIDTLAEKLAPFNDYNCTIDDEYKMILAINLGTLNNFIESEKGKSFSAFKKYVESNDLFSTNVKSAVHQENSVFYYVSFSDYQVFTLSETGIGTAYLEELIGRIFLSDNNNPFYRAYIDNNDCTLCQKCPVRHNFEFLSCKAHQQAIIKKIVEVVIKDKAIVSTRDILNLMYDLMVHPSFNDTEMCSFTSNTKHLTKYIQYTTPMLMYEYDGVSPLLDLIRKHDILKSRTEEMDLRTTRFHSLENIRESYGRATADTPYEKLNEITQIAVLGGMKPELKKLVYRFVARIRDIKGDYPATKSDERMTEYLQYLYDQNSGNMRKLVKLYDATKKAVMRWDGSFGEDYICIDDSNEKFWVLEQLLIDAAPYQGRPSQSGNILRFSTSIKLRFQKFGGSETDTAEINMDYALFELISAMREGYRPTAQDKNQHTDFVSFVQQLIEFGNKSKRIVLVPKNHQQKERIVFESTGLGYEFKVVSP